jgi:hypothetical protein
MKVRAKTSAVITLPNGALLPVGKGKIFECSIAVYNSCWELLEALDDIPDDIAPEPKPVAKPGKDVARAFEVASVAPPEIAVRKASKPRKARK